MHRLASVTNSILARPLKNIQEKRLRNTESSFNKYSSRETGTAGGQSISPLSTGSICF